MSTQWLQLSLFRAIVGVVSLSLAGLASAAVTMIGTRVIYDARSQGQTLSFNNPDGGPSVMQVWVDSGNEQSTPETADGPFVVTPPIFRIEPNAGQTVRLLFTGKELPQDRESVFYLNTLQIPSLNPATTEQNQMLVMVRNRLKIFYRPPGIEGSPARAIERLSFRVNGQGKDRRVDANNASGYYVSVANGSLICSSHTATLRPVMFAPRTETALNVEGDCPLDATPIRVKIRYIDDHGAVHDTEFPVAAQGTQ
ncbi:fimbrial biogenesis chaperone [Paraburkholderia dinghuensis]|uniref:Molecular chaperone n=1 Tax=Paraburkholderia dinghuensis TaxID=2305225 RepID=A0A3N6MMK1_9BURK|nr:molecular chaperone [Paraburkholderia dinghuensis]RQH04728.1 molecular chaperone [Paraburkholderia dinghuensis]